MYELRKPILTLRTHKRETVELNLVHYSDVQRDPLRFDIHKWERKEDGSRGQMYRNGIALSFEEAAALRDALNESEELNAWEAEQEEDEEPPAPPLTRHSTKGDQHGRRSRTYERNTDSPHLHNHQPEGGSREDHHRRRPCFRACPKGL